MTTKHSGEKRKETEEARYRTTLYSIGDSVITTDTEGRVWQMNPAAEKITGWREAEAIGKPIGDIFRIVNEDTRQEVENPVGRVLREGMLAGLANHTLLIARDGREYPITDSGAPIRNAQGEITGVVLVFRDQTSERAAEKALRESERKFRETVTHLDEGYYSCMVDGLLLDHNRAFSRMLGFEVDQDLRGTKLPDFWQNPDDREEYVRELMTGGIVSNYQINAKTNRGEKIVVMAHAHLVKDDKGKPVRIEGIFIDISERMRTEEALKSSEAKYRALFENAQVGIYRSKLDGSAFLDVNDKFAEILGFSRQELLGSPGRIRWANPENRDKMLKQLQDQGGILTDYEVQVIAKNGEVKDVLASIELFAGEGIIEGTMNDITERKQMEETLRQSEEKYRLVAENTDDWIYWVTPDRKFRFISPSCERVTGYTPAEFLDTPDLLVEIVHPDDRERVENHLAGGMEEGEPHDLEYRIITKTGQVCWISHSCTAIYNQESLYAGRRGTNRNITGRKRAEKALRESEAFIKAVLDHLPIGIAVNSVDPAVNFNYMNDNFPGFYRTTREKLAAPDAFWEAVYEEPKFRKEIRKRVLEDSASGDTERMVWVDVPITRKGEDTHYISARNTPVPGQPLVISTVWDVTERKQAEDEIRSLARFPTENPNPVLRIGRDGSLMYANQAAFALLAEWKLEPGKPAPGILKGPTSEVLETRTSKTVEIPCGERIFSIAISPEPEDEYANLYGRDITERKRAEQEIRSLNAELEQRVSERTAQLQSVNEQLESELAERKRAEEALRESEEWSRRLSEAAFEAIIVHDGGILLSTNNQYCEMFGYGPEELLGKQVMPLTIAPEAMETVKKEIATGGVGPYESTGLRKDGTRFPMEIRVRELEYKGRNVRVAAIMDISEHKQAEQALLQRTAQVEAANKELEAFSYSISHDLRSPLRAMDGFSRILLEEYAPQLPAEAQRYLGLVRDNAKQMGCLIEDLLAFSRLSRLPLNKQTFAMAGIVQKALAELRAEQDGRNVEVVIGDLPACAADPALLKQVWVNLLSNALKFTHKRERAHIEIGYLPHPSPAAPGGSPTGVLREGEGDEGGVYFIKDNGVGFDMQYVHKLFGVFQRLHRSEEYEGTGVGLAIVQRIVHRHGGRIWTEAEVDKGAAFYFTLEGGT